MRVPGLSQLPSSGDSAGIVAASVMLSLDKGGRKPSVPSLQWGEGRLRGIPYIAAGVALPSALGRPRARRLRPRAAGRQLSYRAGGPGRAAHGGGGAFLRAERLGRGAE